MYYREAYYNKLNLQATNQIASSRAPPTLITSHKQFCKFHMITRSMMAKLRSYHSNSALDLEQLQSRRQKSPLAMQDKCHSPLVTSLAEEPTQYSPNATELLKKKASKKVRFTKIKPSQKELLKKPSLKFENEENKEKSELSLLLTPPTRVSSAQIQSSYPSPPGSIKQEYRNQQSVRGPKKLDTTKRSIKSFGKLLDLTQSEFSKGSSPMKLKEERHLSLKSGKKNCFSQWEEREISQEVFQQPQLKIKRESKPAS